MDRDTSNALMILCSGGMVSSVEWRLEMCLMGEEGKWIGEKDKNDPQKGKNFVRKDLNPNGKTKTSTIDSVDTHLLVEDEVVVVRLLAGDNVTTEPTGVASPALPSVAGEEEAKAEREASSCCLFL